ncbi:flagellar hook-length control protein FliK [Prosthecodimorpha hirschii]|uniref:flagellar hook-length control protein FliK n=1 Tax=Prosthecodimorpha hirschii TaxID=665126 RepID=UPI00112D4CF7|nr:flagellar hook-length control protein FliK [Prosthecomicrobium hirschii]
MVIDVLSGRAVGVPRETAPGDFAAPRGGLVLDARILDITDKGIVRLSTRLGELDIPLSALMGAAEGVEPGRLVALAIEPGEGGGLVARLAVKGAADAAPPAAADAVAADPAVVRRQVLGEAVMAAAARQAGMARLFADATALATAAPDRVPDAVRAAVADLLGRRLDLDRAPDARSLARAVLGSGVFHEATAAGAGPAARAGLAAGDDLKASLLRLGAALGAWLGPAAEAGGGGSPSAAQVAGTGPGARGPASGPPGLPGAAFPADRPAAGTGPSAGAGPTTGIGPSAGVPSPGLSSSGPGPTTAPALPTGSIQGQTDGMAGARPVTGTGDAADAGLSVRTMAAGRPVGSPGGGYAPSAALLSRLPAASGQDQLLTGTLPEAMAGSTAPAGPPPGGAGPGPAGPGIPPPVGLPGPDAAGAAADGRAERGPDGTAAARKAAASVGLPAPDDAGPAAPDRLSGSSSAPSSAWAGADLLAAALAGADLLAAALAGGVAGAGSEAGGAHEADAVARLLRTLVQLAAAAGDASAGLPPGEAPDTDVAARQLMAAHALRAAGSATVPMAGDPEGSPSPPPRRGASIQGEAPAIGHGPGAGDPVGQGRVVRQETEAALARMLLSQYASLGPEAEAAGRPAGQERAQPPQWTFELPIVARGETGIAQFRIERDERGRSGRDGKPAAPVWLVRFAFDLEPFGAIHALLSLQGEHLSVGLWTERVEAAAQLGAEVGLLRDALEAARLTVDEIHLAEGRPPAADGRAATHFVDRSA